MAKRGRPKSKPIPKWNPRYSKISVRVALQNALTDGGSYDPTREHKRIIEKKIELKNTIENIHDDDKNEKGLRRMSSGSTAQIS